MLEACPIVEMTLKVGYCRQTGLRIRWPRIEKGVQNLPYPRHLIFRLGQADLPLKGFLLGILMINIILSILALNRLGEDDRLAIVVDFKLRSTTLHPLKSYLVNSNRVYGMQSPI